jgi:GT2 family glycosyltransferase
VKKAIKGIEAEVIVVDNNSVDGSQEMIKERFPDFRLIESKQNLGFSKGNNLGIRESKGEYVLLLNPDTVVEEDTFQKCIDFMDTHTGAGALGVKMVDGTGDFLPESKRGLPTPSVAFYKVFGLSKLFSKSKTFNRYHLGYLDPDEIHPVDVLSGAFMFIRRSVLDKIGLLDEEYFMYGEDIDLSYRIQKAGWTNYYFPKTRIIHYKGESTKRGSLNYVRIFYGAMIIFARKHFSPQWARLYTMLIYLAIFIRASITLLSNFFSKYGLLVFDALVSWTGIFFIKQFWEANIKHTESYYPEIYLTAVVPCYILLWIMSSFFSGAYDRPFKLSKLLKGVIIGTVLISAIYGFLPNDLRFSRALILLGAAWTGLTMVGSRAMANYRKYKRFSLEDSLEVRTVIIGTEEEGRRALSLLKQAGSTSNFIGFVKPESNGFEGEFLGDLDQLDEIVEVYRVEEVIFCGKNVSATDTIHWMSKLGSKVDYKIVPEESWSIIGSHSKNTAGDLYAIDINLNISSTYSRRNKRLFDFGICLLCLVAFPLMFIVVKERSGFWHNWLSVLLGKKSWVGYARTLKKNLEYLPSIREGVLDPTDIIDAKKLTAETKQRLNFLYAKDYTVGNDWEIVVKGFKKAGRQ